MGNPIEVEAATAARETQAIQDAAVEEVNPETVAEETQAEETTQVLDPDRTRVDVSQEELGNPQTWYRDQFAAGAEVVQGEVEFEDKDKTTTMSKKDMASSTEATVQVKRDDIRKDTE